MADTAEDRLVAALPVVADEDVVIVQLGPNLS